MGQLQCYHIPMDHDSAGKASQPDDLLEQIREDERVEILQRLRVRDDAENEDRVTERS